MLYFLLSKYLKNKNLPVSKLEVIQSVIDECGKVEIESIFASIGEGTCTKAELISHCLNKELGAYGLNSYTSPDRTTVLINDQAMSHVIDFFKGKGFQSVLTEKQINRVGTVIDFADKGQVDILWAHSGISKKYYYFKQYGFNGLNLYNVLKINTINNAAAAVSPVGAAGLTMAGVIALSWTGSLFFSTLESYIPTTMPRVRIVVTGLKYATGFPVRCVEWTSNTIFGFAENLIVGHQLPTNVTEVYKLNIGPKVKDIGKLRKLFFKWLGSKILKLGE